MSNNQNENDSIIELNNDSDNEHEDNDSNNDSDNEQEDNDSNNDSDNEHEDDNLDKKLNEKLENYIITSMIELSTNNNIDNRCYDSRKKKSLIKEIYNQEKNIITTVQKVVTKLLEETEIISSYENLIKTDPEDEDFLLEDEFNKFISFVGLHTIGGLHGDEVSKFNDKFKKIFI